MREEFYCVLKLVSGEEIFSLIAIDENDEDRLIILQNPIIIKFVANTNNRSFVKVKPWIETSTDDFYIIRPDKVITMTESKNEELIEIYDRYVKESASESLSTINGQIKPSAKMGYIGSVEDCRKKLESNFNSL